MAINDQPMTIGPYRVLEVIGHGGMSTVYKALQPDLDRIVAIKVLHPGLASDPDFRRRFEREARVVARLRHPHIVTVHAVGEDEGRPYLVMEYLDGPTLHSAIAERRRSGTTFAPAETLELLQPVAGALDYAHAHNVIHRDLKPENIILTGDGPVITDFGLAKLIQSDGPTTSMVIGTPAYMAPEQIEGRESDGRSDVYALGILLYELFTGSVPFRGNTPAAIAHAHVYQPAPPLADLNPGLRGLTRLEAVAQRAVAKAREDRWPSAGAMVAALTDAIGPSREATVVVPPVPGAQRRKPRLQPPPVESSRQRLVLLLPLLALLILGLIATRSLARSSGTLAGDDGGSEAGSAATTTEGPEGSPALASETERATITAGESGGLDTATPEGEPSATPQPSATVAPTPSETSAPAPTAQPATPDAGQVAGRIAAPTGAYVRGGPGTAYPSQGGLADGVPVVAVGRADGWIEVVAETGERGWVSDALVAIEAGDVASLPSPDVAPPPPPSPTPVPPPPAPAAAAPRVVATAAPQRAAPPTQAPPAVAPSGSGAAVRVEDPSFSGGWRNGGASVYGGRTATWVYGQGSGRSSMAATFNVAAVRPGTATLLIEGMDSEDAAKTPLRIAVNGVVLFEGASPFPNDDIPLQSGRWSTHRLTFDSGLLRAGANTLTVTNLAPGPVGLPPFVAVDYAVVQVP